MCIEFKSIQIATYTAAEWSSWNGILLAGQQGYTNDMLYTGTNQMKIKVGNGVDTWNDLDFFPASAINTELTITGTIDGVNDTFTCSSVPIQIFNSGRLAYLTDDYTLSGTTVTFNPASIPFIGDKLKAFGNV